MKVYTSGKEGMLLKTKLTLRYIGMVILSTLLLLALGFIVLTNIENNIQSDSLPGTFAYNFDNEMELDDEGNMAISEKGQQILLEQDAWIQFLDEEGYAVGGFNEPPYVADHYSPVELVHLNIYSTNHPDDIFYTGKVNEEINFLMALPSESWHRVRLEFDDRWFIQFLQTMLVLAVIVFILMGYVFSRKISKPVTQIIEGIQELAAGNYEAEFKEKGLFQPVYKKLNQLSMQLKASELEQIKTKEQREKWISYISHDLKTPLSSIKGYSEILSDPEYELSPDEIKQHSLTIHEKSIYMENLIEELRLNESLLHKGIKLDKEPSNIVAFIREIIFDILKHPDYKDREIEFHTTREDIPYSFDHDLFRRSFENLIYNSLLHNEKDTRVDINLDLKDEQIIIDIVDNGQGMTDEDLGQLFNRYYRGSNTKKHKGTGLGMSIAKEVIEAHHGEINVESQIDKGTKINIIL